VEAAVWIALVAALAGAGVGGFAAYGRRVWARATRARIEALQTTRRSPAGAPYQAAALAGLPAPVQRYLRAVLRDGQRLVAAAEIDHYGSFNLSADGASWRPFRSTEHVVIHPPGFVWNGRISALPGVPVNVHDAYIGGEGILHPAVFGVIALAPLHDRGELARGELMRMLAEAVWYPTLLLAGGDVHWDPLDARSARATLHDGTTRVALTFHFNDEGLIERVRADARVRRVGARADVLPWEGRFWNYAEREGMRMALQGEVAWLTPAGPRPYWRGTLDSVRYAFAP
jgi:Family of unknown function (DUF6920)